MQHETGDARDKKQAAIKHRLGDLLHGDLLHDVGGLDSIAPFGYLSPTRMTSVAAAGGSLHRRIMHAPSSDLAGPPDVYGRGAPPPPPTQELRGQRHAAVAVIGAGFTGLSTALHLAEAGIDVVVLEAKHIGWGASGRAFGQVVPYLKLGHAAILRHYGSERGQRIVDAVAAGPDLVFELIGRHRIECWAIRSGLIFAAHSPGGRRELEARTRYWQQRNAPVEMLEGARCAEFIGSSLYPSASLDRRGGNINPFAYARGLAHAAANAGATLYEKSPARSLARRDGRWEIGAGAGQLIADSVVVATNAYTGDLWPGLRESIIPMRGHGFVTEPLSDNVRHTILPERQSLTDTRQLYSGVRMLPDGRLHGSAHGPSFGAEPRADWRRVDARIRALFPQLGAVKWQQAWTGWVAMTTDHFPRLHELAPGLYAGLGYNGRGIAAATMMGRDLAALAQGRRDDATVFPLTPLRPLGWHRIAPTLVRGLVQIYRVRDMLDDYRLSHAA
ncbi:MAG TPA: FAD-dependent oxidoreductase [Acetobacteraceae bacterium]|nr:FAD-dependent oxidoreductase [Acetobacteraceae bacterium]